MGRFFALLSVALLGAGCASTSKTSNNNTQVIRLTLQQELARDKRALEVYSDRIEPSNLMLNRVNLLMTSIKSEFSKGIPALKLFLDQKLLPAYESYLASLKKVPTTSIRLRTLHQKLVVARTNLYNALKSLRLGLSLYNIHNKIRSYKETEQDSIATEKDYRHQLAQYLQLHGLELQQ